MTSNVKLGGSISRVGLALRWLAAALVVASGCDGDVSTAPGAGGTGGSAGREAGASSLAGGGSAGTPGVTAGAAGESPCPVDFLEADGEPCPAEGQFCSDGGTGPCEFGNALECRDGHWVWSESFPGSCGGARSD